MDLLLTIITLGGEPLPAQCPLIVEVRDTSLADAPSTLVKKVVAVVPSEVAAGGMQVRMELASVPDGATVWAHVDADRDGRVSRGDWLTVESYPVARTGSQTLTIRVRKIA